MAKLLYTTEDFYTDPSSFPLLSEVMSGSVYNPTTTSYNITLRTTPLCFYTVQDENLDLLVENLIIKDNAWEYVVSNLSLQGKPTLVCTTIPVIWQTTELLVHNDDIDNIKVAPESVINAMFNVASPDCDGDPTFCIDNTDIENFCSIQWYSSSTTTWTDIKTFSSLIESYQYNNELGLPDIYPVLYSSLTFAWFTLLVYVCYWLFRRFLSSK